jgi:hypothetical protein
VLACWDASVLVGGWVARQLDSWEMQDKKYLDATQFHQQWRYLYGVKRFFSIFFAIYIAAVTCMPCADGDVCADEQDMATELTVALADEHSGEEADFCSPFCVCSCCNSHVNQPRYFNFSFEPIESKTLYAATACSAVQRISYAIWQPPRLA